MTEFRDLEYQLRQIESELTRRHRENGISYYIPNPKQYLAHKSPCKEIFYCGGNRSGKTTFAIAEAVIHTTGDYPDWYPKERRLNRPIKVKIISPKFKEGIGDTIAPKIKSLMPQKVYAGNPKRSPQGYLVHMDVKWKGNKGISTIDFLSQEQDIMSFEGWDADIVISDEPLKEKIFIAIQRGLVDRGGWFICAYTALKEAWMKKLTDKADGTLRDFFVADIRDNKFNIRGDTILKEENIKRLEESMSEEAREVRIHGRYYHLSGLVYKELDQTVHQVDKMPEKYITWGVLDPHDRNPHWMIWAAVDPIGDITLYKELILRGNLYELAKAIKFHEKGMSMHSRIIDPNFGHTPDSVGSNITVQDQLRQPPNRVDFIDGIDDDEAGVAAVREYLRFDRSKKISINNRPKLYFLKGACPKTWEAMSELQYKDWKGATDEREDNERIMEKNKHAADTVRYLCIQHPKYKKFKTYEGMDEQIY